jgi:WD40 repeat protein
LCAAARAVSRTPLRRAQLATLRGHQGAVSSVDFSQESSLLATGGADCCVKLWDLSTVW